MTRCMFERRIPPLKMLSASPTLQIAYPGMGYMIVSEGKRMSTSRSREELASLSLTFT